MTAATAVREKPILFSGEMVRAILGGRKTQTRRIVKSLPVDCVGVDATDTPGVFYVDCERSECGDIMCSYGKPGDRLYVKEATWIWCHKQPNGTTPKGRPKFRYVPAQVNGHYEVRYCADLESRPAPDDLSRGLCWRYKTGRFMPRWASRITLEITGVRVERLQEITEEDAIAEGSQIPCAELPHGPCQQAAWTERQAFSRIWNSINGKRPGCAWADNPWVWCLEFRGVR